MMTNIFQVDYITIMSTGAIDRWLDAWGYQNAQSALHRSVQLVPETHAYRTEILDLLRHSGGVQAKAVFDVDGVPTICFLQDDGRLLTKPGALDELRRRIWNQNLISVVLVVNDDKARALPTARLDEQEVIAFADAKTFGSFSVQDVQSGALFGRHASWFADSSRVDQALLSNLSTLVTALEYQDGLDKANAQFLTAQVLFVAYLEDRGIIGDRYCQKHQVRHLRELLGEGDAKGIIKLLGKLKDHLNGDLLLSDANIRTLWSGIPNTAIGRLNSFIRHDDLKTGQFDMWGYDFRYLPVELISAVYEKFLSEHKKQAGAYYTPPRLANFVVDQIVAQSKDFVAEKVFDGACGSGILLTTAFRRMLAIAEARAKQQYSLKERIALLKSGIFGADKSDAACRVTAFSLYLSLLEGLQPADLSHLTEDGVEAVKLPHLRGENLQSGEDAGDFFSPKNGHLTHGGFTALLCNPPWVEPEGKEHISSDTFAAGKGIKLPRRNTAAAFMHAAADYMCEDAILCWILPVSLFAAPTSQGFLADWLKRYKLQRLVNFGDLRKLLFQNAKQPTMIAMAKRRKDNTAITEDVEYWVPKADVSFAFNRLTLHGSDRHDVPARSLAIDNEILTTLYWGTLNDVATINRLRGLGHLGGMCGRDGPWVMRKGFHQEDNSRGAVSSEPLRKKPFLDAKKFSADSPVLNTQDMEKFPAQQTTIPGLNDSLMRVFKGPRVIYSDGLNTGRRIRAAYTQSAFSFASSLGVIAGPRQHEDALRFLSVYMRSDLACYLMAMTAYQVLFERDSIRNLNLELFPFVLPEAHPEPEQATAIMAEIAAFTRKLENEEALLRNNIASQWQDKTGDHLLARYFGLSQRDIMRVKEVARVVLPNIQPGTQHLLASGEVRQCPTRRDLEGYLTALRGELETWRDAVGGKGHFHVSMLTTERRGLGALGVTRIEMANKVVEHQKDDVRSNDALVLEFINSMRTETLLPTQKALEDIYLLTDTVVGIEGTIYLVKPLVRRFWLRGQAFDDATRVVNFARRKAFV